MINITIKNVSSNLYVLPDGQKIESGDTIEISIPYINENPSVKRAIANDCGNNGVLEVKIGSTVLDKQGVENIGTGDINMYDRTYWDDFEKNSLNDYNFSGESGGYSVLDMYSSRISISFNNSVNKVTGFYCSSNILPENSGYMVLYFGFVGPDITADKNVFIGLWDTNDNRRFLYLTNVNGAICLLDKDGETVAESDLAFESGVDYIVKIILSNINKNNKTALCSVLLSEYSEPGIINMVPVFSNVEVSLDVLQPLSPVIGTEAGAETILTNLDIDFIGYRCTRETSGY